MLTQVEQGVLTRVELPNVEVAYSGKRLGNIDPRFGDAEEVRANQLSLSSAVAPGKLVVARCTGGPDFLDLSRTATDDIEDTYSTDGFFVNRPAVVLGVNPADCNGMVIYDRDQGRALGLIHIGRSGAEQGIHVTAANHLMAEHHVPIDDIGVYFTPSIRKASYLFNTITPEMLADPRWRGFIETRQDDRGYKIDLLGRVVTELLCLGITPEQVKVNPIDVGADPDYFSHSRSVRTGEPQGRNGIVAKLLSTNLPAIN